MAAVGAVCFSQLDAGAGYGDAFMTGVWLQITLLAVAAAITLLLPRRIAADVYQPHR